MRFQLRTWVTNPKLLLAMSIGALLAALWAGLIRMGWRFPPLQPQLPILHGPLMVSGFFGTLISLERAVALRKTWAYLAPILSGVGGVVLVLQPENLAGPVLVTLASLALVGISGFMIRMHRTLYTAVMGLGALSWFTGNLFWLFGIPVYRFVLWWAGFFILIIVGERLELGRLVQRPQRVYALLVGAAGVYLGGSLIMVFLPDPGIRIAGTGLLGMSLWLLRYDIARYTIRKTGLPRFIGACLLSGYVWLGAAGLFSLGFGFAPAGPIYDSILHAIFLGFVFSMVFGHAPIIFPAVLNLPVAYSARFYLPLVLLHGSLALRIAGDLSYTLWARQWGGMLNAVVILAYLVMVGPGSVIRNRLKEGAKMSVNLRANGDSRQINEEPTT